MLDTDWKISKAAEQCAVCAAVFETGQEGYSALIDASGELVRRDYCAACFQNRPEGIFYFWKTSAGGHEHRPAGKAKPVLDVEHVLEFFRRLDGETTAQKTAFRFILALMLARKKVLTSLGSAPVPSGGRLGRWKEKKTGDEHSVFEPVLNPDEMEAVSAELAGLLGLAQPVVKLPDASRSTAAAANGPSA